MWFRTLLDSRNIRSSGSPARRRPRWPAACPLQVEALEDRCVPTTGVSINNATIVEGNAGVTYAQVMVDISGSNQTVKVNYHTIDATALAGSDYRAVTGRLTFAPGEISKPILVPIIGDQTGEYNENFYVRLNGGGKNVTLSSPLAIVTIVDDELHVRNSSAYGSEWMTFQFTVSLSAAVNYPVTVNYATQDDTAIAGLDYQATSGTLTFAPGETSKVITVQVFVDGDIYESAERFYVNLSEATGGAFIEGPCIGDIAAENEAPYDPYYYW